MIRFIHGDLRFYLGVVKCLPMIIGFKLGWINRQRSKEYLFQHFFGGISTVDFERYCQQFAQEIIPTILRKGALEKIAWHRSQGHEIVLVSASPEHWLKDWCDQQQMHCLATQLETKEGYVTGKIIGKNCHGAEKVTRIQARYDLSAYQEIHAYGDTSGDLPMLELAPFKHYKPFR